MTAMRITGYTLLLERLAVEADIGIHEFERGRRQRILISVALEFAPDRLPPSDDIGRAFDYDWIRQEIRDLVVRRRFDLQETLAREIVEIAAARPEILRITVETMKPDVYPDARAVGCRLEACRDRQPN